MCGPASGGPAADGRAAVGPPPSSTGSASGRWRGRMLLGSGSMSASEPPSSSSPQRGRRGGSVASGEPRRSGDLRGRDAELAALADLVTTAAGRETRVLVVQGDPGVGKSTLLEHAAASADGFRTLWTAGVESDALLGHAGLLPLLSPLRTLMDQVPDAQATALAGALGWSTADGPPAPLLVAGATLALLSAAAAEGPLLVVVDDAHWLDRESADALLFAVRRMRDDPVAFLL